MEKTHPETLAERLARMTPRTPEEQAWLDLPPVGLEVVEPGPTRPAEDSPRRGQ